MVKLAQFVNNDDLKQAMKMKNNTRFFVQLFVGFPSLQLTFAFFNDIHQVRRIKEIIATTECDVRTGGYEARLDLQYVYKIVYKQEPLDLSDIERVIATSVAAVLDECDQNMQPIYAVELSSPSHVRSEAGT